MTDPLSLVERLRAYGGWPAGLLTKEAADTIERLTETERQFIALQDMVFRKWRQCLRCGAVETL